MKIVITPSGFEEILSAKEAAEIIAIGVRRILPDAEIAEVPLGDGGEIHQVPATGLTGNPIESHFGIFTDDDEKKIAVLEMAPAGLRLKM